MERALAGMGPHVGQQGDHAEAVRETVARHPGDALRGDGSDVAVGPLEVTLPILTPAVVTVEDAGAKGSPRQGQAVVDRLPLNRCRERHDEAHNGKDGGLRAVAPPWGEPTR